MTARAGPVPEGGPGPWPLSYPRFPSVAATAELSRMFATRRRGESAVAATQLRRLRVLVDHAVTTVPMYEQLYPARIGSLVDSFDDLRQLPIIDKAVLLARPENERRSRLSLSVSKGLTTSGTTGQPFTVYRSPRTTWRYWVQSLLMTHGLGIGWRESHVVIAPRAGSPGSHAVTRLAGPRTRLSSSTPPADLARELLALRPDWLSAQPHQLVDVGEHLDGALRPRTVTTSGVNLHAEERDQIERLYGVLPLDIYGSIEASVTAWQCRARDLYHLNHEVVYLEVVDDLGRPVPTGEAGHLVVTNLVDPVMPFIRYRVGDTATFACRPCACGHSLPALESIQGRTFDWLVDDTGHRVAPQRLLLSSVIGRAMEQVSRYRACQASDGTTTVEVVTTAGGDLDPALQAEIRAGYQRVLGAATVVEVRTVDEMAAGGTKFRQFVSRAQTRTSPLDRPPLRP